MNLTNPSLIIYNTLTPTHVGSGTDLGYTDLPIQRETHTGIPKIESSTLKGCLRPVLTRQQNESLINQLLGDPNKGDYAAAVSFTDARLLFFPVKSVIGIFAWITCPYVLERFQKDCKNAGLDFTLLDNLLSEEIPNRITDSSQLATDNSCTKIMLEDYLFTVQKDADFTSFVKSFSSHMPMESGIQKRFVSHAVLLSDDDFTYFVKYATEVNTRIKINPQTGTVDGTALFTEEFLPPESILYSLIFYDDLHVAQESGSKSIDVRQSFLDSFNNFSTFQIGADATLGKGLVCKTLWKEGQ